MNILFIRLKNCVWIYRTDTRETAEKILHIMWDKDFDLEDMNLRNIGCFFGGPKFVADDKHFVAHILPEPDVSVEFIDRVDFSGVGIFRMESCAGGLRLNLYPSGISSAWTTTDGQIIVDYAVYTMALDRGRQDEVVLAKI